MNQRILPSKTYAWYTVVLLTIVYIVSLVDRYILGLLVEPIKADMGLSDIQIGLLLGPAFAVFYATMGLPLGWLADRASRKWLVGIGATLWSLATAASGLATSFLHLFAARIAVGVGEATLSPCALSIIGDSFEEKHRGRPVAFYSAATSIGAGIAALVGASVLLWSKTVDHFSLPLLGVVAPWQLALIVVGLVGLPFAFLLFTLREPLRQGDIGLTAKGQRAGLTFTVDYLRQNISAFSGFVGIVCVMTTVAYSQSWLPAMFERTWGWAPEQYALYNGIALIAIGPLTVNIAGWWADELSAKGYRDAPLRILFLGLCIMVPAAGLGPLMPGPWLCFSMLTISIVGIAMISAVAPTALLNITPSNIRGQTVAIYFLTISLTGLVLGPMTVGLLNDWVFGELNLRYSVALVPFVYGLPVLIIVRRSFTAYREKIAEKYRQMHAPG